MASQYARYSQHVSRDPLGPRVSGAIIETRSKRPQAMLMDRDRNFSKFPDLSKIIQKIIIIIAPQAPLEESATTEASRRCPLTGMLTSTRMFLRKSTPFCRSGQFREMSGNQRGKLRFVRKLKINSFTLVRFRSAEMVQKRSTSARICRSITQKRGS